MPAVRFGHAAVLLSKPVLAAVRRWNKQVSAGIWQRAFKAT
jgi:hypothetical protein